jgi:hypothetical protein
VYGRRRKGSKAGMLLALLLVGVSVGMALAACGPGGDTTPPAANPTPKPDDNNQPTIPPGTPTPGGAGNEPSGGTPTPESPVETPIPTPCQTPPGNWEFVGKYKPSAYVINVENDFLGGDTLPIKANPPEGVFQPGYNGPAYLSARGYGYYTSDENGAQKANEKFLYSYASVCLQGTGKLTSGLPITCTAPVTWEGVAPESLRPYIKFQWGSKDRISKMEPYETVAVCPTYKGGKIPHPTLDNSLNLIGPRPRLWLTGTGIENYFISHGATDSIVEVVDVGEGLCSENKIDIYIGDGLSALAFGYDDLVNGTAAGSITSEMDVYIEK